MYFLFPIVSLLVYIFKVIDLDMDVTVLGGTLVLMMYLISREDVGKDIENRLFWTICSLLIYVSLTKDSSVTSGFLIGVLIWQRVKLSKS